MTSINNVINRGALIIFEGCDRSGKSTQSKRIADYLTGNGYQARCMNFPARDTPSGKLINSYLTNKVELSDETIHLLFSANRWELKNEMKKILESGTTLVVDRYSYSGVAFSTAKGLNYDWCKAPEKGLIKPDLVLYLNTSVDVLADRGNFGNERYEKIEFQRKVEKIFNQIYMDEMNYWIKVNAAQSADQIHEILKIETIKCINEVRGKPIESLW